MMKVWMIGTIVLGLTLSAVLPSYAQQAKKGTPKPMSGVFDTTSCDALYILGEELEGSGTWDEAADTLKHYIERCYNDPMSGNAFGRISSDIDGDQSPDDSRFLSLREWLFNVLYLSPDTLYYCSDAAAAASTFKYYSGPRGDDFAGRKAVIEYLIESGKCPYLQISLEDNIPLLMEEWHAMWLDSVKDSLATPFDTTLPTLQQIGFEILLGPQNSVAHQGALPSSVLGAIQSSPNPFTGDVEISFTLNVPATLTVEVFDLLGAKVATLVPAVMTLNGDHVLKLSGTSLASGTYYARFTVPEGEVRTIKLIKE